MNGASGFAFVCRFLVSVIVETFSEYNLCVQAEFRAAPFKREQGLAVQH